MRDEYVSLTSCAKKNHSDAMFEEVEKIKATLLVSIKIESCASFKTSDMLHTISTNRLDLHTPRLSNVGAEGKEITPNYIKLARGMKNYGNFSLVNCSSFEFSFFTAPTRACCLLLVSSRVRNGKRPI